MCVKHLQRTRPSGGTRGVTLLEVMVALMIGGMVLLGLGYVYGLNYGLWMRGQTAILLHSGATRAIEEISRDAGHASDFTLPGANELHLLFPASPMGGPVPAEIVYQVRERRLWRDTSMVVPQPGDTNLGVAAFRCDTTVVTGTAIRMLTLHLALFAQNGTDMPADTLRFETTVYARNRGLGATTAPLVSTGSGASGGFL